MRQKLIIDGSQEDIVANYWRHEAMFVETTSLGDSHQHYIYSGISTLNFEGVTSDGRSITGVFTVLSANEVGVMVLTTMDACFLSSTMMPVKEVK